MASINDLAAAAIATSNVPVVGSDTSPQHPSSSSGVVRGALIVLEGLDRSGKTTQVKLLEQRFVELGHKAKVFRFPGQHSPLKRLHPVSRRIPTYDHISNAIPRVLRLAWRKL
jgi:dTMP kinase